MGFEPATGLIVSVRMGRSVSLYLGGLAGLALLLLRCSLAAEFVALAYLLHVSFTDLELLVTAALVLALLLGFATQIAVLTYVGVAIFEFVHVGGVVGACVALTGSMAISLVLLGPGAFSLDARLYGRREISLDAKSDTHNGYPGTAFSSLSDRNGHSNVCPHAGHGRKRKSSNVD